VVPADFCSSDTLARGKPPPPTKIVNINYKLIFLHFVAADEAILCSGGDKRFADQNLNFPLALTFCCAGRFSLSLIKMLK